MKFCEEGGGGVYEFFAGAGFDAGAFGFVGFFGVAAAVGEVAPVVAGQGSPGLNSSFTVSQWLRHGEGRAGGGGLVGEA